jgi:hypothetical protein
MVGHSARSTPRASNQKDGPPRRLTRVLTRALIPRISVCRVHALDRRARGGREGEYFFREDGKERFLCGQGEGLVWRNTR